MLTQDHAADSSKRYCAWRATPHLRERAGGKWGDAQAGVATREREGTCAAWTLVHGAVNGGVTVVKLTARAGARAHDHTRLDKTRQDKTWGSAA